MTIPTRFGNVLINKNGYLKVCSEKEGNFNRLLHRLIYEDYYGIEIPSNCVIHHINGNKLDNRISNLQMMTKEEHGKLHNTGENNPSYNVKKPLNSKIKLSKKRNSTGFFRVSKKKDKAYRKGYTWQYRYNEKGEVKIIIANKLEVLKQKVIAEGLIWAVIDKNNALKSIKDEKRWE